jgi:hypothetical protein
MKTDITLGWLERPPVYVADEKAYDVDAFE